MLYQKTVGQTYIQPIVIHFVQGKIIEPLSEEWKKVAEMFILDIAGSTFYPKLRVRKQM